MELRGLSGLPRQRRWRRWTLASFLARLPITMTLLALVLAGSEATGSLAIGAQLAGVATLSTGLAAPWRGRRLDGSELRGGLQRSCLTAAAAFAAQALAVATGMPLAVLFALAVAQGLALAAVSGGYRALLPAVVDRADLERANALEAVFVEVAFVSGPALAGALALAVGAVGVLLAMAASVAGAAAVTATLPRLHPQPRGDLAAPWRDAGTRAVYGIAFVLGVTVGLLEAVLPARAAELGQAAAAAGPLLALLAAGSGIGGVVATLRGGQADRARRQALVLLSAFGLLLAPVALAGSMGALAVALLFAGLPIAPLNALGAMRLQAIVPDGRQAEGFAVYIAAIVLGAGAGQVLAGVLLPVLPPQPILLACVLGPLLVATAVVRNVLRGRRSPRV